MEKKQAESIAQAILEPDLQTQEEIRRKHAVKAAQLARKRQVAWYTLGGAAVGAAIAYFTGTRFSMGIIFGGLAGSAVGWLVTRRAA